MQNKKVGLIIVGVLVLVGAFYGGMAYGKNSAGANVVVNSQNRMGQFGGMRGGRMGGGFGGGFVFGNIISKDANSITVQIVNNDPNTPVSGTGSKIIFLDAGTMISKTTVGSTNDLSVGEQVSLNGTPNSDGSIIAKNIQIRPQMGQNTSTK